eukprot:3157365-Amphidinium_carterae.1
MATGGTRTNDLCHIAVFQHPPRSAFEAGTDNHQLAVSCFTTNVRVFWCTTTFPKQIFVGEHAGDLREEVASNGYGSQLVSKEAVQGYLNKDRARAMQVQLTSDEMLAVICYTGTDAYSDLRSCMRKGVYSKWPRFQYHLRNAVWKLANFDNLAPSVTELYHGLANVEICDLSLSGGVYSVDREGLDIRVFVGLFRYPTFISTSWDFNVAERFAFGLGEGAVEHRTLMVIQVEQAPDRPRFAADVSWISKFGDTEREILLPDNLIFFSSLEDREFDGYGIRHHPAIVEEKGYQEVHCSIVGWGQEWESHTGRYVTSAYTGPGYPGFVPREGSRWMKVTEAVPKVSKQLDAQIDHRESVRH